VTTESVIATADRGEGGHVQDALVYSRNCT
jgi:hypothetical protein